MTTKQIEEIAVHTVGCIFPNLRQSLLTFQTMIRNLAGMGIYMSIRIQTKPMPRYMEEYLFK